MTTSDLEKNCLPRCYGPAKRPEGCEFRAAEPSAIALPGPGNVRLRVAIGGPRPWARVFWLDMSPEQSRALRQSLEDAEVAAHKDL